MAPRVQSSTLERRQRKLALNEDPRPPIAEDSELLNGRVTCAFALGVSAPGLAPFSTTLERFRSQAADSPLGRLLLFLTDPEGKTVRVGLARSQGAA